MDCYSTLTLDDGVPCSIEDGEELKALIDAYGPGENPDDDMHGLTVHSNGEHVFLDSSESESADPTVLPSAFLKKFGEVLTKAKLKHIGFGLAFTASKLRPGTHGGNSGRIYADGRVVMATQVFPDDAISS